MCNKNKIYKRTIDIIISENYNYAEQIKKIRCIREVFANNGLATGQQQTQYIKHINSVIFSTLDKTIDDIFKLENDTKRILNKEVIKHTITNLSKKYDSITDNLKTEIESCLINDSLIQITEPHFINIKNTIPSYVKNKFEKHVNQCKLKKIDISIIFSIISLVMAALAIFFSLFQKQ